MKLNKKITRLNEKISHFLEKKRALDIIEKNDEIV